MSMFDWDMSETLGPVAPGPAATSLNGAMADAEPEAWDGTFPGETGHDAASAYLEARLDRVELATLLVAAGLACIALAFLVYLRRAR
jgi:hypothetical protein